MQVLKAENITHDYGLRPLFESLELVLEEGEKVCLVGPNGCGKSTLIRILDGIEVPLGGTVTFTRKVKTAFLAQEPRFRPGTSIYGALEEGLADLAELKEEYEQVTVKLKKKLDRTLRAELTARAQKLHDTLDTASAWDIRPRIEEMVTRLRLPDSETLLDNQSGGTVKRVALGQGLLCRPDILFLDEPTNHLDTETVVWLEKWLQNYRGTLILITHDRYFLESVVDRIAEISCGRLQNYPGNYSAYLEAKKKQWELAKRADEKRLKILVREIAWLKSGIKARTTKQKARIQRIMRLASVKSAKRDKQYNFYSILKKGLATRFSWPTGCTSLSEDASLSMISPSNS